MNLKTSKTYLLTLLYILVLTQSSVSFSQSIGFKHYGVADGLLNSQTRKVIEMPDHRILVQEEGMFSQFDGQGFQHLEYGRDKTLRIESNLNTDYYFDHHNRLWVKDNNHLYVLNTESYSFLTPSEELSGIGIDETIANFFILSDGSALFSTTDDNIYLYDWTHKARLLMHITSLNVEGKTDTLADALKVGSGYALFFSNGKMSMLDDKNFNKTYSEDFISDHNSHRIKASPWSDDVIIVRDSEGLIAYNLSTHGRRRILYDAHVFEFRRHHFSATPELYASSNTSLYLLDKNLNVVRQYDSVVDEQNGTPITDHWQGMTLDWQGGVWAATFYDGIYYHPDIHSNITFSPYTPGYDPVSMMMAHEGRRLPSYAPPPAISDSYTDSNGIVWLPTRNMGIIAYYPNSVTYRLFHYSDVDGLWGSIPFIREISHGKYMTCHRMNRIALFYPDEARLDDLSDKYPELQQFRNIVAITDVNGGFLIGTQNGFFCFDTKKESPDMNRFSRLNSNPWSDKCNCLYTDPNGIIWIGTQNGLLRYDEPNHDLRRYSSRDGMPNNCVQSIQNDRDGNIWVATLGGICRMRTSGDVPDFMTLTDRWSGADSRFSERMSFAFGDSLFFATVNGIIGFDPRNVEKPQMPLTPQLISLTVGDSVRTTTHDTSDHIEVTLHYNENYVTLDISSLNYAYPETTIYRYKIDGSDSSWLLSEVGKGKLHLTYPSLSPGRHTLIVQSSMQGQTWGPELRVTLNVLPPWWQTWWAYLLYLLIFLALVGYIAYSYIKHQRALLDIEQKEAHIRQLLEQIKVKSQIPEDISIEHHEEIDVSATDEVFLKKAMDCIEANIDNPEYGVEMFSSDMAMERTTLYRHLQASVGRSPKEFIRIVRLKRAAELLRKGGRSVGEVADMVGFNNRKSFAKYFRESFGVLPSKYK